MKITKISVKNFKSFGNNPQVLEMSPDNGELILLTGQNGNGKSALISAFDFGIFGKAKGTKKKWSTQASLPNRINGGDLLVEVTFFSGEDEIKVTRGLSPNILKLFVNGEENTRAGKSNVDAIIQSQYAEGLDAETFKSFISLSINDFKNFMSLTTEEKQLLLDKLFNLEIINKLSAILKDITKSHKQTMSKIEGELYAMDSSLQSIQRSMENLRQKISNEQTNAQIEINEKLESLRAIAQQTQATVDRGTGVKNELYATISTDRSQLAQLEADIAQNKRELALYDSGKCPTCKTAFDGDFYDGLKSQLTEKLNKSLEVHAGLKSALVEKEQRYTAVCEKLRTLENSLASTISEGKMLKARLSELQNAQPASNGLDEFEKSLSETTKKIESKQAERDALRKKEEYQKELAKILGEDGVKKKIIAGIIAPINAFLAENVKAMGLPFDIELDESFNAEVRHMGTVVDHDTLSTGETKLLNINILCAYLMLIRTKKHINVLFLDEVFSSIDLDNISNILNLLSRFAKNYKINIFVVHHAIMNSEYFDRIITIKKDTFTQLIEE